jgi:hypothetical protein
MMSSPAPLMESFLSQRGWRRLLMPQNRRFHVRDYAPHSWDDAITSIIDAWQTTMTSRQGQAAD